MRRNSTAITVNPIIGGVEQEVGEISSKNKEVEINKRYILRELTKVQQVDVVEKSYLNDKKTEGEMLCKINL